ncbi:MAG: undecaprenyl-diphosphate phosphatase [Gammaproteobacteria bacterium]|nr:undecaprenyl-diphosphate phosphatase [Gammaproteobacteria bacterium]
MDLLQALILALVQGVTEFLPISSSAHLILVPRFLGWPDQGLAFDVAVHFGTLTAVVGYFRRDVMTILSSWTGSLVGRPHDRTAAHMGWAIVLATIPLVFAGLLFEDLIETRFRSPLLIAATTAVFGLLLWVADRRPDRVNAVESISLPFAVLIGLAQTLALVPGTSRSGVTMTAGLALGLDRETAARFAFLIAIPAITGAAILKFWDLVRQPDPVPWLALAVGLLVAAASAWLCIKLFLQTIQRIGMLPFVLYRLVLAAVIVLAFR